MNEYAYWARDGKDEVRAYGPYLAAEPESVVRTARESGREVMQVYRCVDDPWCHFTPLARFPAGLDDVDPATLEASRLAAESWDWTERRPELPTPAPDGAADRGPIASVTTEDAVEIALPVLGRGWTRETYATGFLRGLSKWKSEGPRGGRTALLLVFDALRLGCTGLRVQPAPPGVVAEGFGADGPVDLGMLTPRLLGEVVIPLGVIAGIPPRLLPPAEGEARFCSLHLHARMGLTDLGESIHLEWRK